jgi:hypothetical protein
MGECHIQRWSIETTAQGCLEYLQLESTKSYGQQTVLRFTPCLFGLYPLVVQLSLQLPRSSSTRSAVFGRGKANGHVFRYDDVRTPCLMGTVVFSHTG